MSEFPAAATDATTLGDLLARERRTEGLALRALTPDGLDRTYSYRDALTTAWKSGNFLRHLGVRGVGEAPEERVSTVEVAPDPLPEPVFTFLGAAGLGARTAFDPRADGRARVTVVGVDDERRHDPPPGSTLVVYGGAPASPEVDHWEEAVWSENPRAHPAQVGADGAVLVAEEERHSHAAVLDAARSVVDETDLEPGDRVAVRAGLADPRVVVAGVVAPLLAGATVVFPDDERRGAYVVGEGPEAQQVSLPGL
ncbi:MAG: acetyl-CoA synthetase [Haloferacaceae archaeon]